MNIKAIMILLFTIFNYSIASENWEEIINNNREIKRIESREIAEEFINLYGVVVGDIRLEELSTNLYEQYSSATITLEDLRKSFLKSEEIKEVNVKISDEVLYMNGKAEFLGMLLDVELSGVFELNSKDEIVFTLQEAKLGRYIFVPRAIINSFHDDINPIFDLKKIKIPLYLSKIVYKDDKIIFE